MKDLSIREILSVVVLVLVLIPSVIALYFYAAKPRCFGEEYMNMYQVTGSYLPMSKCRMVGI